MEEKVFYVQLRSGTRVRFAVFESDVKAKDIQRFWDALERLELGSLEWPNDLTVNLYYKLSVQEMDADRLDQSVRVSVIPTLEMGGGATHKHPTHAIPSFLHEVAHLVFTKNIKPFFPGIVSEYEDYRQKLDSLNKEIDDANETASALFGALDAKRRQIEALSQDLSNNHQRESLQAKASVIEKKITALLNRSKHLEEQRELLYDASLAAPLNTTLVSVYEEMLVDAVTAASVGSSTPIRDSIFFAGHPSLARRKNQRLKQELSNRPDLVRVMRIPERQDWLNGRSFSGPLQLNRSSYDSEHTLMASARRKIGQYLFGPKYRNNRGRVIDAAFQVVVSELHAAKPDPRWINNRSARELNQRFIQKLEEKLGTP